MSPLLPAVAETNPWSGVAAFTADMKPAHNPNNPFLQSIKYSSELFHLSSPWARVTSELFHFTLKVYSALFLYCISASLPSLLKSIFQEVVFLVLPRKPRITTVSFVQGFFLRCTEQLFTQQGFPLKLCWLMRFIQSAFSRPRLCL